MNFPANSLTVVTGPNGSGKSTLINLLLKFNGPNQGTITIGGIPSSQFSQKELRTKISVVTQYHHIFHDSLRANLQVANPTATDDELIIALQQVGLSAFLNTLPKGLDETMAPCGKGLSGGEKQRICIARLLLRKSSILILDEPWSNVDVKASELLLNILGRLKAASTVIIISHRHEFIHGAEQQIALDGVGVQNEKVRGVLNSENDVAQVPPIFFHAI